MATQTLSAAPTTLKKNGSTRIDADTWYTIQNKGNKKFFLQTATTPPSGSNAAFAVGPFSMMQVKRTGTQNIYVWQNDVRGDGEFGTLVIEPSE